MTSVDQDRKETTGGMSRMSIKMNNVRIGKGVDE